MISPPADPSMLTNIRTRLDAGDIALAIAELDVLIGKGVVGPDVFRLLALAHLKAGEAKAAQATLARAREAGTNAEHEVGFGRFLNGGGYKEAALDCFLAALEIDEDSDDALALICMHYADQNNPEAAQPFGQRCLDARDRQASSTNAQPIPRERPRPFNPNTPNRNIIALSLFGTNSYYWDCAIASASMAFAMFPEWRCRIFCDGNVPQALRDTLLRLKCQLYLRDESVVESTGLLWRFLAFDDPEVDVVMVRDIDSPFTLRERLAVDEWIASDIPFHVIRDHLYHTEPMLAGLWGGWTKLLPPMSSLLSAHKIAANDRYTDQKFLRLQVWPRIRRATLVHDRHFHLGETRRPPSHPTEAIDHIGMGWPRGK